MTKSVVVHTEAASAQEAGPELGTALAKALGGSPDAVVLFAPPR
jgi:hypothetical protein